MTRHRRVSNPAPKAAIRCIPQSARAEIHLDQKNFGATGMQRDEQEIRNLVATWLAATKTGDVETVLSLMADDVVFLVPGQPPMRRAEFAAAAESISGPRAPQFDSTSDIQEIQLCGDWAFMWTKLTVVVTPSGSAQAITRAGNTLTIFKKHGTKWLLARDANLLTTVPRI